MGGVSSGVQVVFFLNMKVCYIDITFDRQGACWVFKTSGSFAIGCNNFL